MTKKCEITGKTVLVGNNVSHSNRKTKRRFLPNLQAVRFFSEALGQKFKFRISVRALKTIEHHGGLDSFLMKTSSAKLTEKAQKLKKQVSKAQDAKSA